MELGVVSGKAADDVLESDIRNGPGATPFVLGCLSMRLDVFAVSEECEAVGVCSDSVDSSIEIGRLAIGRKDVGVKEISDTALRGGGLEIAPAGAHAPTPCSGSYRQDESNKHQTQVE